jgi:putative spermidine/putrescine transport system ATP-binding protein
LIASASAGGGAQPPAATKLSVRNVAKSYGPVVALADTSLEMVEGEFLTLLGPSGSGKTTLLMIVAGLTEPSSGEVWIGGQLATHAAPNKRDIGMVFQNYALFPHMTIAENIGFPLRMRRVAEAEVAREVSRVLEMVQLPHVAARMPKELSGGQQQRIALARCMVYQPSIILMDEPLGALDRKLRDHMQMEIKALHKRLGITILYVTHDQEEALAMSDRICLMNHGRIEQLGTPADLYFRPRSEFVADFLGESNILAGEIAGSGLVRGPGGLSIQVPSTEGLAPGQAVKLVVRPEAMRLLAEGDIARNEVSGTIVDTVFGGGLFRHFVAVDGGPTLMAKQFADRPGLVPAIGQAVRLGWDADQTVVLAQ